MAEQNTSLSPNSKEHSPRGGSGRSSISPSRDGSNTPKEKHRVRFTPGGESLDSLNQRATFDIRDDTSTVPRTGRPHGDPLIGAQSKYTQQSKPPTPLQPKRKRAVLMELPSDSSSDEETREDSADDQNRREAKSLARTDTKMGPPLTSATAQNFDNDDSDEGVEKEEEEAIEKSGRKSREESVAEKVYSQERAQARAQRLSRTVGTQSAPTSRRTSPTRLKTMSPPPSPPSIDHTPLDLSDIPLEKLETKRTKYGIEDDSDDENEHSKEEQVKKSRKAFFNGAGHAARKPTKWAARLFAREDRTPPLQSGQTTPVYDRDPDHYVPRPKEYREGYLSSLMKLYNQQGAGSSASFLQRGNDVPFKREHNKASSSNPPASTASSDSHRSSGSPSPPTSHPGSGTSTPKAKHEKWYYKNKSNASTGSIADLISTSTVLAQPGGGAAPPRPNQKRNSRPLDTLFGKRKFSPQAEHAITIQVHVAETIQRQRYILRMCKALMTYGAPTHRLEEYLRMSARVLAIDGEFLYMPGCMIISFDDKGSHTTEVKIVRATQAVDLSRLSDVHEIYKEVIHDKIDLEEAMQRLDEVVQRKDRYGAMVLVLTYGLASAFVGPFAFQARPIDLPISFVLGAVLGFMRFVLAPRSEQYANIFEISAAVLTSFIARAVGSIRDGNMFCFSAIAQSSIALILPGYTVLCGALELVSRNILAGSVRMVYAIIFSLFLGFGITIGTSLYGWVDKGATSATTCGSDWPLWWQIIFVPPFALCLIIINQGKFKQMPAMGIVALSGWVVNHFSALRFASNVQIANALGALAIGVMANLYSRVRHGLAAAVLLPAIWVQVPSGLAATGSLVSGVASADQIVNRNDTQGGTVDIASTTGVNTAVLNVGYSMVQVAIGITVGLFIAALVVYPFGKRRSGLFSF